MTCRFTRLAAPLIVSAVLFSACSSDTSAAPTQPQSTVTETFTAPSESVELPLESFVVDPAWEQVISEVRGNIRELFDEWGNGKECADVESASCMLAILSARVAAVEAFIPWLHANTPNNESFLDPMPEPLVPIYAET